MKKIILTLAAIAMGVNSYGQGLITYYNRVLQDASINGGASRNEPITLDAALGGGNATAAYSIGLFKLENGVYTLAPGQSGTGIGTFRTDNSGTMVGQLTVVMPNAPAGTSATFVLRAWLTSQGSFDGGLVRGESAPMTVAQLGGTTGSGVVPTPNLSGLGFRGFVITPEPSTYALGIAGLGALAFLRRRK
jgi:hypothetical protein